MSIVSPDVKINSQWQAHFLQIFPFEYDTLPAKHPSDKKIFNKYYQGPTMDYKNFMKRYYPNFRKIYTNENNNKTRL